MALRTPLSVTPHLYMGDSTGRPLDNGVVYFGEQDKDPEFYPINLFSDDALTKPLAQPVHTKGGYLYDKGDMVEPHAKEIIYSVKVLDSYGRKVFYKGAMMRNSWNDDVIEQINAAIVASTELARQVATDITNDAINNTAVEGGVLADTFVVVDGSLSQRTVNKGLESISNLSTINNPKDGLRVYVKSYHAGLGKGGGYFTYDSTKAGVNDGGIIIDGWVREGELSYVYPEFFGAVSDGVTDDFLAFKKCLEQSKSKRPIYLSDSSYFISEGLLLPPCTIKGSGADTNCALVFDVGVTDALVLSAGYFNLEGFSLKIDGGVTSELARGIVRDGSQGSTGSVGCNLSDLRISHFNIGLNLNYGCYDLSLSKVKFIRNNVGCYTRGCNLLRFYSCFFNTGITGIRLGFGYSTSLIGCTFEGNTVGIDIRGHKGVDIIGGYIENNTTGLQVLKTDSLSDYPLLEQYASAIKVSGTHFNQAKDAAIDIYLNGCRSITVDSCFFRASIQHSRMYCIFNTSLHETNVFLSSNHVEEDLLPLISGAKLYNITGYHQGRKAVSNDAGTALRYTRELSMDSIAVQGGLKVFKGDVFKYTSPVKGRSLGFVCTKEGTTGLDAILEPLAQVSYREFNGIPNLNTSHVGEEALDTTSGTWYKSTGTGLSWKAISLD